MCAARSRRAENKLHPGTSSSGLLLLYSSGTATAAGGGRPARDGHTADEAECIDDTRHILRHRGLSVRKSA
ncbi:hypothetical protein GN956_G5461 [Arapaima gigas]